jgi:hypothetical protein
MAPKLRLLDIFEGKSNLKIVLAASVFLLLAIEIVVFVAAATSSGENSFVEVKNERGQVVYRTPGNTVGHIHRPYFEKYHGPLNNYQIEITTISKPFPVREWIAAAVGIPVGLILLTTFLVKVYLLLVYGEEKPYGADPAAAGGKKHLLVSWSDLLSSFSIYYIGALTLVVVLLLWLVPNFLGDLFNLSVSTVRELSWFFFAIIMLFMLFVIWVVYLRYKLSKKMMENQLSLEKYRIDRQLLLQQESENHRLITADDDKESGAFGSRY